MLPEVHYCAEKSTPLVAILNQFTPSHSMFFRSILIYPTVGTLLTVSVQVIRIELAWQETMYDSDRVKKFELRPPIRIQFRNAVILKKFKCSLSNGT